MNVNAFLIVIALSAISVVGDVLIKIAGGGKQYVRVGWFALGMLLYALTAFGWLYVMKHVELSSLGAMYALTTILLLLIVGVVIFHETVTLYEGIGITAAIISLVLLNRFAA